jgi:hypothetical protein
MTHLPDGVDLASAAAIPLIALTGDQLVRQREKGQVVLITGALGCVGRARVVLHGMLSPEGALSETEVVASSDASLNQSALQRAAKWQEWQAERDAEPGAAPQSHEVFFTVQFALPAS